MKNLLLLFSGMMSVFLAEMCEGDQLMQNAYVYDI